MPLLGHKPSRVVQNRSSLFENGHTETGNEELQEWLWTIADAEAGSVVSLEVARLSLAIKDLGIWLGAARSHDESDLYRVIKGRGKYKKPFSFL